MDKILRLSNSIVVFNNCVRTNVSNFAFHFLREDYPGLAHLFYANVYFIFIQSNFTYLIYTSIYTLFVALYSVYSCSDDEISGKKKNELREKREKRKSERERKTIK